MVLGVLNKSAAKILPYLPDSIFKYATSPYLGGETLCEVIKLVEDNNEKNIAAIVNILGEEVKNAEQVKDYKYKYENLIRTLAKEKLNAEVSVKLTQFGLEPTKDHFYLCLGSLEYLLECASENNIFVRIDMEGSRFTDNTIKVYKDVVEIGFRKVGFAVQANLKRTKQDLEEVNKWFYPNFRPNVRLCKGAYIETEDVAYNGKEEIRQNFLECLEFCMANNWGVGIATHDVYLIEKSEELIKKYGHEKNWFEMLKGVNEKLLGKMALTKNCKKYITFGKWEDARRYCERRVKENPKLIQYVASNFFKSS